MGRSSGPPIGGSMTYSLGCLVYSKLWTFGLWRHRFVSITTPTLTAASAVRSRLLIGVVPLNFHICHKLNTLVWSLGFGVKFSVQTGFYVFFYNFKLKTFTYCSDFWFGVARLHRVLHSRAFVDIYTRVVQKRLGLFCVSMLLPDGAWDGLLRGSLGTTCPAGFQLSRPVFQPFFPIQRKCLQATISGCQLLKKNFPDDWRLHKCFQSIKCGS